VLRDQSIDLTFLITRHCQTTDNEQGLISGKSCDPFLSLLGKSQAEHLNQVFRYYCQHVNRAPVRCVTSTLKRTIETANIMCRGFNMRRVELELLKERGMGELEGQHYTHYKEEHRWGTPPGGEDVRDFAKRTIETIANQLTTNEPTVFVVHSGNVRFIKASLGIAGDDNGLIQNGVLFLVNVRERLMVNLNEEYAPYLNTQIHPQQLLGVK
jgi:broad specificity phosphatase PhoE